MARSLKALFLQIPTLLREQCARFGPVEINVGDWANIMVGLCLPSAIQIVVLSAQINSELPTIFHFVSFSFVLAFVSFFVGKFTGTRFPLTAQVLERVGMLFAVTGFFMAVTIPFPFWLKVTTWVLYVVSFAVVLLCNCYNFFDEAQVQIKRQSDYNCLCVYISHNRSLEGYGQFFTNSSSLIQL